MVNLTAEIASIQEAKADAKAAKEANKTEADAVLKKLLASGMSADEILEKLKLQENQIIVSDYEAAKNFYVNKLGFSVIRENYRLERKDWKLDLKLWWGQAPLNFYI